MNLPPSILQAILEDPANDQPRLVAADWLEENGEDARAEFIRVQCELLATAQEWLPSPECDTCQSTGDCPDCGGAGELAGDYLSDDGMSPCERCRGKGLCGDCGGPRRNRTFEALQMREKELFCGRTEWYGNAIHRMLAPWNERIGRAASQGWDGLQPAPSAQDLLDQCPNCTFRRGFVDEVSCVTVDWIEHGPLIVREQPVQLASLSDWQPRRPVPTSPFWEVWPLPEAEAQWRIWPALDLATRAANYRTKAEACAAMSRFLLAWAHGCGSSLPSVPVPA